MTEPFTSLDDFAAVLQTMPGPDLEAEAAAQARNDQLTKPPGALGRLESLAIWLAAWRGDPRPRIERPQTVIFAGNHGIAARGVSAFPSEVTAQMVANFEAGGAAINQLCAVAGARLSVHALDLETPTKDFSKTAAMTEAECVAALSTGWRAIDAEADALIVGEMGIGNTTSAAALGAALFNGSAEEWTGAGAGADEETVRRKTALVAASLARHAEAEDDPLDILRRLGGREIAAMAGAIASARMLRIPVILDGFICTAAAAVLERARPGALDHCVAGHLSGERAHRRILAQLGKRPILDLEMRLGEGSGAAAALLILKAAAATHSGMATFAEAGVAGKA